MFALSEWVSQPCSDQNGRQLTRGAFVADCFLFNLFAFRCMVRRISIEIRIGLGNAFAPDGKTIHLFVDFVAFCVSMTELSLGSEQPWYPCRCSCSS